MPLQTVPARFPLLAVTMLRSTIRTAPKVREALRILGLKKPNQIVYHRNNAATRGVIRQAIHHIRVTETAGEIPGTIF